MRTQHFLDGWSPLAIGTIHFLTAILTTTANAAVQEYALLEQMSHRSFDHRIIQLFLRHRKKDMEHLDHSHQILAMVPQKDGQFITLYLKDVQVDPISILVQVTIQNLAISQYLRISLI